MKNVLFLKLIQRRIVWGLSGIVLQRLCCCVVFLTTQLIWSWRGGEVGGSAAALFDTLKSYFLIFRVFPSLALFKVLVLRHPYCLNQHLNPKALSLPGTWVRYQFAAKSSGRPEGHRRPPSAPPPASSWPAVCHLCDPAALLAGIFRR
jgi:hypothetical protein